MVAARGHRASSDQRIVGDNLGANEAAGDVAVDFGGGQLGRGSAGNRPRPALVFAHCEKRHIAEQIVTGTDDAIEPRFRQTEVGQKRRGVGRFELSDLELDLGANRHSRSLRSGKERPQTRVVDGFRQLRCTPTTLGEYLFVEIDHDQQRLCRQELETTQPFQIVTRQIERP